MDVETEEKNGVGWEEENDDKDEEEDGWPWTDDEEDIVSEVLVFASCGFLNVSPETKTMLRHGLKMILIDKTLKEIPDG